MQAQADVEFSGSGVYMLWANTQTGLEFILENVSWQEWQGSPEDGIAIDGAGIAWEIALGAMDEGMTVALNGRLVNASGYYVDEA